MRLIYAVICLYVLMGSPVMGQLRVYPQGMLNPRVPIIVNQPQGAVGKAFVSHEVSLGYLFGKQLGDTTSGKITCVFRAEPGRLPSWPLVLMADDRALAVGLTAGAEGRHLMLAWLDDSTLEPKFSAGSILQKNVSSISPATTWHDLTLQWDKQQVILFYEGKKIASIKVQNEFSPTQLVVNAWSVDELKLTAQGSLTLDWEHDYAARIMPAKNVGVDAMSATLLGFDTFVVDTDPASRHYPMIQVNNPTMQSQKAVARFTVKRELTGEPWQWQQTFEIKAGQSKLLGIAFPKELGSDVYHLKMALDVAGKNLATMAKHFLHTPKRHEAAGPKKFGLHDCNVRQFGFWPDPLPIDLSHLYLRWGYVQGPFWVKDWDGNYGMNPNIPADQWHWNRRMDWASDAGRDLLVCVQSTPFSDWSREHDYPIMKKLPWTTIGGHPNLKRYRNFLREAAKRYAGKVKAWEIENEPNASTHIPFDRYADYVQICKAVYDEIKSADPNTQIFGISGTSRFQPWMDKVLGNGGANYMDGISWHTYTSPNMPDEMGFPTIIKESVDIVKTHKPDAPIWNSETGVVVAMRYDVDKPISQEIIAQKIRENDVSFVANSWMGAALDEWRGGASMIANATYNFLAGVDKFVFFGWNPQWPTKPKWVGEKPFFSILSSAADGTRTPSLMTLAVANYTTQMQGALLKNSNHVTLDGVKGGIFKKANGGKLAVIWAPSGKQSVMLKTDAAQIEIVDMLGQSKMVKVVQGIVICDVTDLPMYVHVKTKHLAVTPGPVAKILVKANGPTSGICEVTLTNRLANDFKGKLQVYWIRESGKLFPMTQSLNITTGQSQTLSFAYALKTVENKKLDKPQIGLTIQGKTTGSSERVVFHSTVDIPTKPVVTIPLAQRSIRLHQSRGVMLEAMKAAHAKLLKLDRLEQVKLGRPPALASLHDPAWWGGKDELSSEIYLAADKKGLVLYMDVLDIAARKPQTWPSVKGSVVELFFDFRKPGKGLGDPAYGDQTFQVLLKPQLTQAVTDVAVWSPQREKIKATAFSQYDKATKRYWLVLRLPWSGPMPEVFGFDIAINASPMGRSGRKTQMILFGTASNARSASDFGQVVLKP